MDGYASFISDSLQNLVTGLGTAKDRAQQGQFIYRTPLGRDEIASLYSNNWIGGKLVDVPADDATREWRAWTGTASNVQAVEQLEEDLDVAARVNVALKLADRDGGAAIILGVGGDPREPIRPNQLRRGDLQYLLTVSRFDLAVGETDRDPASRFYGQAKEYVLHSGTAAGVVVHPSRVILFTGTPRLDTLRSGEPWGDSIYERLYDAIRDATAGLQGLAALMQEAKVDVVSIPGLTQGVQQPSFRSAVISRFALAMAAKAINNTLILDANEKWEQKTLTFAGWPEALDRLLLIVAGARDMPVTRLLGRSPAGLNATGESDLQQWYDHIAAVQQTRLRPALRPLDAALVRSAVGRDPRAMSYTWRPLYSLGADERATIADKQATAVEKLANTGLLDRVSLAKAVAERIQEDGFLPGAQAAADPGKLPPALAARPATPSAQPSTPPSRRGGSER